MYLTFVDSAPLPVLRPCLPAPPQAHLLPSHTPDRPTSSPETSFVFPFLPRVLLSLSDVIGGEGRERGHFEGAAQGLLNHFSPLRSVPSFHHRRFSAIRTRLLSEKRLRFFTVFTVQIYGNDRRCVASAFRSSCFPVHWDGRF